MADQQYVFFAAYLLLLMMPTTEAGTWSTEYQRYDGWYNNLAHPDWGSVESHIIRKTATSYSDGVYMISKSAAKPSARLLSQHFMRGPDGQPSAKNRTTLLPFFGEFLAFDILQGMETGCPFEVLKIPIARCDASFDKECQGETAMPILRTRYDQKTGQSPNNPRAQTNMMSSWLDGSAIYSTKEIWLMSMRSWSNGTLNLNTSTNMPLFNTVNAPIANPAPSHLNKFLDSTRLYLLGDPRSNQHPPILAISILFYRFHNVMARKVQAEHPGWSDEEIFQQARRWVIGIIQNIALYEYLPAFLDVPIEAYRGYQADIHPGVADVFQAAAFRFGHTQIPAGIYVRDDKCNFKSTPDGYPAFRLCNTWFDSQVTVQEIGGIEPLIMGLASQIAEKEDAVIIDDLRDHIFGPMEFSRRDLAAVNVMRGRDYGLPDYNAARRAYKLNALSNWSDINKDLFIKKPEMVQKLQDLYQNEIDNVDLYVGGMLECDGNKPGPLFTQIIKEQFLRLRDADRFWFENTENPLFTPEEVAVIKSYRMYDVIIAATSIPPTAIQKDVFFWRDGDVCPQPSQMRGDMLEPCVSLGAINRDVFSGNEVPFLFTCALIGIIPMLSFLAAYILLKYRGRKRRKYIKHHQDQVYQHSLDDYRTNGALHVHSDQMTNNQEKGSEKVVATEWLHCNLSRPVKVKFASDGQVHVENRKGNRLRTITIKSVSAMMLEVTEDSTEDPLALLRIHKEHDLVLIFENMAIRRKFIEILTQFLKAHGKELVITPTSHEHIFTTAETKEKRQQRLERFFKIAYAQAFGIDKKERSAVEQKECEDAMNLKLTRVDFAEALAMKPTCVFIEKMFNCIDRQREGRISFQQFLQLIMHLSQGDEKARIKVLFDMCDSDRSGLIEPAQLFELLRSLLDMTASQKGAAGMDAVTWKLFEDFGLKGKKKLSFDDFFSLITDQTHDLSKVGLDFKGVHQTFFDPKAGRTVRHDFVLEPTADVSADNTLRGRVKALHAHLLTYIEEHKQQIFYLCVFYVAILGVWIERFSFYMFLNETSDLRKVMGVGIAITRGSAAAMSLAFSILLMTVCRNIITWIRDLACPYIPFDSAVTFHKVIALTGGFFALVHTIGHLINFYHVSTQPIEHLRCLFREMSFGPAPPSFAFWVFKTLTGLTGVLLVIVMSIMFVFALWPKIQQQAYRYFWLSHRFGYIAFYVLCILHGLPRLTGEAHFPWYLIVPTVFFVFDRLIGVKQTALELEVIESELLPSDVVHLKFTRPPDFVYRSGQWIRLFCTAFCPQEAHPFTLTTKPHDNYLSVHVKAQGIWTWKLREAFDTNLIAEERSLQPRLRIEGPFGGGNQDWYKYETVVMVGAGMGVTPYASILKDLVFGTSTNRFSGFHCKKVYFMWICPSHKPFEWFVETLHEIEKLDVTRVLEMHIFVTQFFNKFDLRTTMLYVCENHFQRLSKKSLFTGLKAINHFGRPDIPEFLRYVKNRHRHVATVGVLSCGPKTMTENVGNGCELVNRDRDFPRLVHHSENF
ncbi:Dual oxidase [Hypsibius exemplaris]|uniref:NAD(P)H oxidase (H2O2-forming) n=1 Tax=Hypsibius exemplaris TaxID=2072580 RepID=A0A1W0WDL5_HYPEX|nr:Dual oxidase [Hypsibius exemplaris]